MVASPREARRFDVNRGLVVASVVITCLTWTAAAYLWHSHGNAAFAVSIFLLGLSLGPCLCAYALVSLRRKQALRRLVLLTGGLSIMAMSLLGAMNLDLEGFFMLLLSGTVGAAVGHTMITVIAGPMLFGRFLCGWGCWRAMVFELLPITRNRADADPTGKSDPSPAGKSELFAFGGLAMSFVAAVTLLRLGHHPGGTPQAVHSGSVIAIAAGFGLYYLVSISLAFTFRDQRAFCKYLCPNSVILRRTSRLSLVKMGVTADQCNGCGACSRVCPMDIPVADFAESGSRVMSGECILCQRCAHACPTGALHMTFG